MSYENILEPEFVYEDFHDGYLDGDVNRRIYRINNPPKRELATKLSEFFMRVFHLFIYKSGLVNERNFTLQKYFGAVSVPVCTIVCLSEYLRYCIYFIMKIFKRRELRALGVLFISKNTNKRKGSYEIVLRKPSYKFTRIFGVHKPNENLKRKGLPKFVKNVLESTMKSLYYGMIPNIKRGNDEEILIKCYVRRRRGKKNLLGTNQHIDYQLLKIRKKKRQHKKNGTLPMINQLCDPIHSQYLDMMLIFKEFDNTPATL
ncbi:Hypothetical protein SRAE_1000320000 [Strongyloides ratti]|uniref:Uncharacterized protein n=1 Tax=Strongyloides ratti TaxID=34506 RepID=A0A090L5E1_STRRB|nr:Hypothetical protein SRAE_1000320000 [Strongyloides ratti]CEF64947.1 Hypothetical protein SRAE_1000320000 [Strongyloides ratti]